MKKVVVFCSNISHGGIGTYLLSLSTLFGSSGFEVILVTTHYRGDLWKIALENFSACYTIEDSNSSYKRIIEIIKLINRVNPSCVIINNTPMVNYALPFIRQRPKVISVIHSDDKRYYKLDSIFSYWIDHFIAPSVRVKDSLINFLPQPMSRKSLVIPHGSLGINYQPTTKIPRSIIFIGNIDKHKGVELLPFILEIVSKRFHQVNLHIVGVGPLQEEIKEHFAKLELSGSAVFHGKLDRASVIKLLRTTEVLLFPTRLESFGYVIPEAMLSHNIPVISNLPGITDQFVIEGYNGFLCNPLSVNDFAESIISIFDNPGMKQDYQYNSHFLAQSKFSFEKMREEYIGVLELKNLGKINLFGITWFVRFFKSLMQILLNERR